MSNKNNMSNTLSTWQLFKLFLFESSHNHVSLKQKYYFMHFKCMIIIIVWKGAYLKNNFGAHVKNKHV
jgi:hypothetical protein